MQELGWAACAASLLVGIADIAISTIPKAPNWRRIVGVVADFSQKDIGVDHVKECCR